MKNYLNNKKYMVKNISKISFVSSILLVPIVMFAQVKDLNYLAKLIVGYINTGIYLIIVLAVVVFTWNIYKYFIVADPANKKEAGMYVLYSIIGFFIILSFWGLVYILKNTLKLDDGQPTFPFGIGGSTSGTQLPKDPPSGKGTTLPKDR